MRELVAGIAIGLAAGWLLFQGATDAPSGADGTSDAPAAAGGPAPAPVVLQPPASIEARRGQASAVEGQTRAPAVGDRSRTLRSGNPRALATALALGTELRRAEVEALIARLYEAQRQRDSYLFKLCVQGLGRSGHPRAHAFLVELAADLDADLPPESEKLFEEHLKASAAPGIVQAARARIEGSGRRQVRDAWARLLIAQGTEEDVEWLLDTPPNCVYRTEMYRLLVAKPLERAQGYMDLKALQEGAPHVAVHMVVGPYAAAHPTQGLALLEQALLDLDAGAERAADMGPRMAMVTYTQNIPPARWPAAARFLAGLRREELRIYAAQMLGRPALLGIDPAIVQDLLDQPAATLRRVVDADPPPADAERLLRLAQIAIAYSPKLHTAANAAALEYAAGKGPEAPRDHLKHTAAAIRKQLGNKEWR